VFDSPSVVETDQRGNVVIAGKVAINEPKYVLEPKAVQPHAVDLAVKGVLVCLQWVADGLSPQYR